MTELLFKGKEFVFNHHLTVPYRPLEPHPDKGVGGVDLNGNLIIQGDNLHALKALMPIYAGKVDCIFIDPPYNTGNEEWSYNDNVNAPQIKDWLKRNPINADDTLRHDKWCAMMWPRLRLLHELLAEDGLVFISIDDIENARLVSMVTEVFGEENYVGQFIWKSRQNKDNRNKSGVSNDHEYILIVGKKLVGEERIIPTDQDAWDSGNMVGMASKQSRPNLHFDLINPKTNINYGCPERGWRYNPARMSKLIAEDKIIWPSKSTGRPREKVFRGELESHTNVSSVISRPLFTRDGTSEFKRIIKDKEFSFPKPHELIQFLVSQHLSENSIVLDSFAGSGTTAHAVLEANKADGGNRKFILVEMENNIADEVCAERVRRVIKGYRFSGKQKTELLRKKLTFAAVTNADFNANSLLGETKEKYAGQFDRIAGEVKDNSLIISGETDVKERAKGLGGTFTYCTLGDEIELKALLSGGNLPKFSALGPVLFQIATNQAIDHAKMRPKDFYLGETAFAHFWLIYQPDVRFLKSGDAALTLSRARAIAAHDPDKQHLVFAPARFVSRKLLAEEGLAVDSISLPDTLYRMVQA
jgi:adenine-specific DNA-methyltransferase